MMWLEQAFSAIVDTSWRAALLVVVLLVIRTSTGLWIPRRVWFAAWVVVAIRLLVPVGIPASWSPYKLFEPAHEALTSDSASASGLASADAEISFGGGELVGSELVGSPNVQGGLWRGLSLVWACGVVGLMLVRVAVRWRFRRSIRRGSRPPDARLAGLAREEAVALGIDRTVRVAVTNVVGSPAITGCRRAQLLMPQQYAERLSDVELRFVLRHELGHWYRRDLAAHALLHTAAIVHWFNPFVWLATWVAARDCESACDEFVLRRTRADEVCGYGATLLKAFAMARRPARTPQALGIFGYKKLKRRLHMIINHRSSSSRRTAATAAILGLVIAAGSTHETLAEAVSASITETPPEGWFENGSKMDAYVVGVDPTQTHMQPFSAYVKSIDEVLDGFFGGMMQTFSAANYRGKRVQFSAYLKTKDVKEHASLWMRVDGPGRGNSLAFDNMAGRSPMGTTDWQQYAVVLDVPMEADNIALGFFVSDTGHAWVNGASFVEVSNEIATTEREIRKAPANLGFAPESGG